MTHIAVKEKIAARIAMPHDTGDPCSAAEWLRRARSNLALTWGLIGGACHSDYEIPCSSDSVRLP